MPGATRAVVINTPVEKVFAVIKDYARLAEFYPEVKIPRVPNRQGDEVDVQCEVDVLKKIGYPLRLKEEPPSPISWTFVEGELMRDNRGHWLLEDLGGGKTRATYN